MDIEKVKEDLSICYLKAISAVNKIALEEHRHDDDSTDVEIKKEVAVAGTPFISTISVQLKASSSASQYSEDAGELSYKLKAKNYNDLCKKSNVPKILALLILPTDENEWLNWNPDTLLLKGRMFWLSLSGKIPTENKSTVTVKIPKSNVLNIETVQQLIQKGAEEGTL